jgi:hypothetical protein
MILTLDIGLWTLITNTYTHLLLIITSNPELSTQYTELKIPLNPCLY